MASRLLRPFEYVPGTELELDLELKALYDDPEYAKDDAAAYFSMRDNGRTSREDFLKSRTPERMKRIEREETRIGKLRAEFFKYGTKKELVKVHTERRHAWKQEVRECRAAYMADLNSRIQELEKQKEHRGKDTDKQRLNLMNEKRVLFAISRLPSNVAMEQDTIIDVISADTPSNRDDVSKLKYGLKAYIMHFNKGKGGHTHHHKCGKVEGKFPNQKVPLQILLSDTEDNPLKEPNDPGKFRYFHLPTNNMAWVEVSHYYQFCDIC